MKLEEIMTKEVRTISPTASVRDAAKQMDDENVGALPVCDGDELVGIVTDRDIIVRSTSIGQDPITTSIRDVMTIPAIYAMADQSVEEGAEIMKQNAIRRLPVLDRANRLIGIVSADDLLTEAPSTAATDALRTISQIERPGL